MAEIPRLIYANSQEISSMGLKGKDLRGLSKQLMKIWGIGKAEQGRQFWLASESEGEEGIRTFDGFIGQGGYSLVKRGQLDDLPVALKFFSPNNSHLSVQALMTDFVSGGIAMMGINHPHIMPVLGITAQELMGEMIPVLVMPMARKLEVYQENNKRLLTKDEIVPVMDAVASGLDYLASRRMAHLDVSPSNIMITYDELIKLNDFDTLFCSEKPRATWTVKSAYFAPELQKAAKRKRAEYEEIYKVDQFQLAMTIYVLLTGNNDGFAERYAAIEDFSRTIKRSRHQELTFDSGIGKEGMLVLRKATEFDPKDRYSSCQEFASELAKVIRV